MSFLCESLGKASFKITFYFRILAQYILVALILCLFLNIDKTTSNSQIATQMMKHIRQSQINPAVDEYLLLCKPTLLTHLSFSRSTRRQFLHNLRQFAAVVYLSLLKKRNVIRKCLELTYTLSKSNFGVKFGVFTERMDAALEGDHFEMRFQGIYRELATLTKTSAKEMELVADYMLNLIKATDFSVLEEFKRDLTKEGRVMVKKLFLIDKVYREFGIEIDDVLKMQKAFGKNRRLQSKFIKIGHSLRK